MIQNLLPSNGTVVKAPLVTTGVVFGALLAPVVVIAHDADCSRKATLAKDAVLTRMIKAKLAAESPVRLERVVAIARATECVRVVHSEIKITKGPTGAAHPRAQAQQGQSPRAGDRGVQEAMGLSLALALLSGAGVTQR